MADWADINTACGKAIRVVPTCYRLQRSLPGPLNDARALRLLTVPSTDAGTDLNPWRSEEGRELFQRHHGVEWERMEVFTKEDGSVSSGFAGTFKVIEVTRMETLAVARLRTLF